MKTFVSVALAAIVAMSASLSPAWARGEFTSGNWEGAAYFDGRNFSHCAMSADYRGGDSLLFSVNSDGQLMVGLSNPDLNLTKGARADMRIQIDNNSPILRTVEVVNPTLIATVLTTQVDMFNQVRRGNSMVITIGTYKTSYSLLGTYNALVKLLACAANYS